MSLNRRKRELPASISRDIDKRTIDASRPSREPHRIEEVFDIEFRKEQLKHYRAVRTMVGFPKTVHSNDIDFAREWLASTSDHQRQTGRTTLMALCWLEFAAENHGRRIDAFDHHTGRHGEESLLKVLNDLVRYHPTFERQVEFLGPTSFVFHPFGSGPAKKSVISGFMEF